MARYRIESYGISGLGMTNGAEMKSDTIRRLQDWYISNCDGDWEHGFGVKIDTLDNPGWSIRIDLEDTPLEGAQFEEFAYGVADAADASGEDWICCRVVNGVFEAAGGPAKLDEMLTTFLTWAENNTTNPQ